jgi:magnesium chelatase subunit I
MAIRDQLLYMEFTLHGLAEFSLLSKFKLESGVQFKDMLSSMFTNETEETDGDPEDFYK